MKTDGQRGIQTAGVKLIGKAEKTWVDPHQFGQVA
jgi:hypothetical protein